jgi:hypothetical protein
MPGESDTALIADGEAVLPTNHSLGVGHLVLAGGTLTLIGSLFVSGDFDFSAGTLNCGPGFPYAGTLTVNGTLDWTGGTMAGVGHTDANNSVFIGGSDPKTVGGGTSW